MEQVVYTVLRSTRAAAYGCGVVTASANLVRQWLARSALVDIIGHARIRYVGKYQPCMV